MHHVNRNLAQALHDERSNVLAQELVKQKDEEPTPTEDTAIGYTCAIMATIFFLNLALTWFDDELFGIPQRLWEFVRALMPLAVITTLYCRLAFGAVVMTPICGCGIAASAVGLALFKFGLGHGVIPFAEKVGEDMPEHSVAVLIAAMLGLVATFAEPDLASLQMVGSHAHNLPPLLSALLTEKQLFLLGYESSLGRMYCVDKEMNFTYYNLNLSLLEYQCAMVRKDFATAEMHFEQIPEALHTRVARYVYILTPS